MRFKKFVLGVIAFYICESIIVTPFPIGRFLNFGRYQIYHAQIIKFSPRDRVLIVSPHPDDAVLSSSGVIQEAQKAGAKVKIVYITYGSHNETTIIKENKLKLLTPLGAIKLGEERYNEAVGAAKILGLKRSNLVFLGFPDFGTLKMWTDYFDQKSYFSGLTLHNKVFYKTAYSFGSPFQGKVELLTLEDIISKFSPTKIFYPSLLDLNSDHRATGLFVRVALSDLNKEVHPTSYTYLVHSEDWPQPYGYFPDSSFSFPNYIKRLSHYGIYTTYLSKDEEDFKKEAIEAHKSQVISNKSFMYSFVKNNEIFFTPFIYKPNEYLPLWEPKILQKIGIIPYIKSVIITTDSQYYYYNVKFYSGIPLYTKINLFIYGEKQGESFQNSSRYRFIIGRSVLDGRLYYKIKNGNKFINFSESDFNSKVEKGILTLRIQKKYLNQTDSYLSSLEMEKGDVRVLETPWWEISVK